MNKVKLLETTLSNKIAAGEVIERPSSVVKELVENAIDADATKIDIFIEAGGIEKITVIDNGCGMSFIDAKMCFQRHATSKIYDIHDLNRIRTLGFRGEAIPSIASISNFTLQTCDGETGGMVSYAYGVLKHAVEGQFKKGSKIEVSDLMVNVPARLKYLKGPQQEFNLIYDLIQKLALSNPQIAFSLYHNGHKSFVTNGSGELIEVIAQIYGNTVAKQMVEISIEDHDFKVSGYITKLETTRASKRHIHTLVNARVIKNAATIDAVNQSYRQYLMDKRFPIAVINIEMDHYLVDVNVHPSKWEVRFSKEDQLKALIQSGISSKMGNQNLMYQASNVVKDVVKQATFEYVYQEAKTPPIPVVDVVKDKEVTQEVSQQEYKHIEQPDVAAVTTKKLTPIGQIHGTYMIASDEKHMYILDQHAAQERIYYEYYSQQFMEKNKAEFNELLVPHIFELSVLEYDKLQQKLDVLAHVGVILEPFGDFTFICKQLPTWMMKIDAAIYIEDMIEFVLNDQTVNMVTIQKNAIASLSCKASIKANHYLSRQEMQQLLDDLMKCKNPYVCPHGRPTVIVYSDYDLEKMFKRVT